MKNYDLRETLILRINHKNRYLYLLKYTCLIRSYDKIFGNKNCLIAEVGEIK